MSSTFKVADTRHPKYFHDMMHWTEWREVYAGGDEYTRRYLRKFTERETDTDFHARLSMTPTPSYAKAALNDIRNAIFQRMRDITRRGGSTAYMQSVAGERGGIDLKGSTMNGFFGIEVLTELLVMGKVGVYVDMPELRGPTLADVGEARPYCYLYQVEDILSWSVSRPEDPSEFQALLLRDKGVDFTQQNQYGIELPTGEFERYRLIWRDKETGFVNVQFFDKDSNPITPEGYPSDGTPTVLELQRIPFTLLNIGDSLLKDVAKHQAALLNLTSSDVAYALKANYPFYVEQQDLRAVGDHLKHPVNPDGSAMAGGQRASKHEIRVGPTHGRVYDLKADAPQFIHPSPEPLEASIRLQEKLEDDIRKLVNLAVTNKIGKRATSAEALKMSDQGLEAGLSFIGLVLENAERRVAGHWAAYEDKNPNRRQVAVIKYPERYSLKSDLDRIEEAKKLSELVYTVPGVTVKKELTKSIVLALLSGKVTVDTLDKIYAEIDRADYTTSDPETIIRAKEAGLVGEQVASMALGFKDTEYLQAREDHAKRILRIQVAQSSEDLGARGIDDLDAGESGGKDERARVLETDKNDTTRKPVRGDGETNKENE